MKKISEKIYSNKSEFSDVASENTINDFFDNISQKTAEKWPYDFDGYTIEYDKVTHGLEQAGMAEFLKFQMTVKKGAEEYIIVNTFHKDDDNINLEINSMYRPEQEGKSAKGSNFSKIYLAKIQDFLLEHDNSRDKDNFFTPSQITLLAKSARDTIAKASAGGYIWANQGFDFRDAEEIKSAQEAFQDFAVERGIAIKDKDIKKLKKPYQFSSFDNGELVKDKYGKDTHIGKAFLLEYSWYGKWNTENANASEKVYAKVYNNEPRKDLRHKTALKFATSSLGSKLMKNPETPIEDLDKQKTGIHQLKTFLFKNRARG